MARMGSFLEKSLLLLSLLLLGGCGDNGDFPIAAVKGTVTCEGKPVPHVMVFFEPKKTGESAIVGKQGFGRANENGEFVITTYDENDGAVVGPHVVHVLPPSAETQPGFRCPCEFDSKSHPIDVEIKKDGKNEFVFALPPKKGAANAPLTADQIEQIEEAKANK